ncbi:KPN_02809 family neutral zinc metallopeptidase [Georgenia sp. Z1344]|uniref:KPN_02809 family neutral zinc metallopeptidase n=1 Tax=Georgenia sp. Z1344 TaxID=3416706 RepID=UPI003CEA4AAE
MTFRDSASGSGGSEGVRRRGRGRGGAAAAGGGGLAVVALVIYLLTGQDLGGLMGGGGGGGGAAPAEEETLGDCTGADANTDVDCRMVLTWGSLHDVWAVTLPEQADLEHRNPEFILFQDSVGTGCGNATSAVGPFYCPPDESAYIDTGFFDQLETQLGAENAPLAQMYILAHEYGHHVQNETGVMATANRTDTGPQSDGVRLELQADCYAGIWVNHASTVPQEETGEPMLVEPTTEEIQDALDAASAVGDDRIQSGAGQEVNPETWTHGSSEQRMHWFTVGYEGGTMQDCDTFAVGQI